MLIARLVALCAVFSLACRTTAQEAPVARAALLAAAPPAFEPLRIHHINVQQGDCTLIVGPDGTTMLIDAGKPGHGWEDVAPYLAEIGIFPGDGLDYMVCTHRDADHLGGLDEVIEAGYDVTQGIWDNGSDKDDPPASMSLEELQDSGKGVYQWLGWGASTTAGVAQGGVVGMPLGAEVELGDGATATCVAVGGAVHGVGPIVSSPSENDMSVAILVQYGDFDYITAGDLGGGELPDHDEPGHQCTWRSTGQANIESPLAKALMPGGAMGYLTQDGVEVLDVNHHGSESSTNREWMNLLSPTVAVINTGSSQKSNYHHPREDVVERVLRGGADCITVAPAVVLQTAEGHLTGSNTSFDGYCVGDVVISTRGSGTFEVTATGQVGHGPDERDDAGLLNGPRVFLLDGATAGPSLVFIVEIMQNPSDVPDNVGEWFELYNPGSEAVNIDGWTIRDDDSDEHVIQAPGGELWMPAGGRAVLGRNGDTDINGGIRLDYVYSGFNLANGADEIVLVDISGDEVDRVAYTGHAPWPDPTGASMQAIDPDAGNATGDKWTTASTRGGSYSGAGLDLGTPGTP